MGCCGGDNEVDPGQEKKKYGNEKKHDANFKGPIQDRGCTDVICCIIYIAYLIGLCILSYFAYSTGDPRRLIYPTDYQGNLCGYKNVESGMDLTGKPYLFYFNILECAKATTNLNFQCPTPQYCVTTCPTEYWFPVVDIAKQKATPSYVPNYTNMKQYCKYGFDPAASSETLLQMINNQNSPPYILKSQPFVGRCIPTILQDMVNAAANTFQSGSNTYMKTASGDNFEMSDASGTSSVKIDYNLLSQASQIIAKFLNLQDIGAKVFKDFTVTYPWLIGLLVVAMVVALFWIVLMRWIAGVMVWLIILFLIAALSGGLYYTVSHYLELKNQVNTTNNQFVWTTNVSYYTQTTQFWLAMAIIDGVVLLILILMILCLCKRIRLAIQLIKEASRAVSSMMTTLFWPLFGYALQIVALIGFGLIAIYIASNGSPYYQVHSTVTAENGKTCTPSTYTPANTGDTCVFVKYGGNPVLTYMHFYNLLGMFWNVNFMIGLSQMVLAGAFASWYWAFNKPKDIPMFPLASAFWRSLRYHLGTIAFGSLLIALVQLARAILEYMDNQLQGSENRAAKFLLKCLKCCFWCLEKFLRFISKNAYIMCAIYGKNFCSSAKEAFFLLMRNIVRVAVLTGITNFMLFMGRLMVSAAMGGLAFILFSGTYSIPFVGGVGTLNYYWVPIIIVVIATYVIASLFFDVYGMAIDTIFLAFLEDCERHDGSPEKPYFMSKDLMSLLGKKNKKAKEEKKK